MAVLLPSVFCVLIASAQTTLSEKLNYILVSQDMDNGMKLYSEITDDELKELPDSSLFDYHYLGAYINNEIACNEKAMYHFLEAKKICDTKLGTYSIAYMEIMGALGNKYLEMDDYDNALATFQEGIVKSMAIREAAQEEFSNMIMGIQECYERHGWFNEVPQHLIDAWGFWGKDATPLVTNTYFPLWCLEQFYSRYGKYEKALSVSNEIEKFIISKEGENSGELCNSLYMKGNILVNANRHDEAITAYKRAINIANNQNTIGTEILGSIYGNLLTTLATLDRIEECDDLLQDIQSYSQQIGDISTYNNALYYMANTLNDKSNYEKAVEYNTQLLHQTLTEQEKEAVESLANKIRNNQEITAAFPQLEIKFNSLGKGSNEWFDIGYNLSHGLYLKKDYDKSYDILKSMYDECHSGTSNGRDYHYWILLNIYDICMDLGRYDEALEYAFEKYDFVKSITDASDYDHFDGLNDIIASKIRANNLIGIDENLEQVEPYFLKLFGKASPQYAVYLHNRGRAYQLQNKLEEARETLLKSISMQNKVTGKPLERTIKLYQEVEDQLGEL